MSAIETHSDVLLHKNKVRPKIIFKVKALFCNSATEKRLLSEGQTQRTVY